MLKEDNVDLDWLTLKSSSFEHVLFSKIDGPGTKRIRKQQRLRRTGTNAQIRQRTRCSHTCGTNIHLDVGSGQIFRHLAPLDS